MINYKKQFVKPFSLVPHMSITKVRGPQCINDQEFVHTHANERLTYHLSVLVIPLSTDPIFAVPRAGNYQTRLSALVLCSNKLMFSFNFFKEFLRRIYIFSTIFLYISRQFFFSNLLKVSNQYCKR